VGPDYGRGLDRDGKQHATEIGRAKKTMKKKKKKIVGEAKAPKKGGGNRQKEKGGEEKVGNSCSTVGGRTGVDTKRNGSRKKKLCGGGKGCKVEHGSGEFHKGTQKGMGGRG